MVSIHGGWWVGIGIFMYLYTTLFIEPQVSQSLVLFKIVAIVFVLWGALVLSIGFTRKKPVREQAGPPKRTQHPHHHGSAHQSHGHVRSAHGSDHKTHQHLHPHKHPSHHGTHTSFRLCPHCHRHVPNSAHQCRYCGQHV